METYQRIVNLDGLDVGDYIKSVDATAGTAVMVQRAESLGGGTIVLPARELTARGDEWVAPYEELSVLEAPPYSPNVALNDYLDFWRRLGDGNANSSPADFMATGSGPVASPQNVPDPAIEEQVNERLRNASGEGVDYHLIQTSVNKGTVLLKGDQNDTSARLAAAQAAASVPGVKEIVNMLIIRSVL